MGSLLSSLLTVFVSAIVTGTIGVIIKRAVEKKIDENNSRNAELEELRSAKRREERKQDVLSTLREELKPLNEKVDNVRSDVSKNTRGTVTLLRERMEQSHDKFIQKGSISAVELANWHHLFNTYEELGGNHFREYVDEWKSDVDNLPREIISK